MVHHRIWIQFQWVSKAVFASRCTLLDVLQEASLGFLKWGFLLNWMDKSTWICDQCYLTLESFFTQEKMCALLHSSTSSVISGHSGGHPAKESKALKTEQSSFLDDIPHWQKYTPEKLNEAVFGSWHSFFSASVSEKWAGKLLTVEQGPGEPSPPSQWLNSTVQTGNRLWTPHLWKVNTEKEILLPRALKHSPCKRKKDLFKEFFMQREEEVLWSPG